jgi:hypothetical protein
VPIRARIFAVLLLCSIARPSYSAKLTPEANAAFDRYVQQAETRIQNASISDAGLRGGELRITSGGNDAKAASGMIQDWVGAMFIPGATIAQAQAVLRDYPNYKKIYAPRVIESREIAHHGDEYDAFLRLFEKHVLTVVLNTTYHVRFNTPDPQHLTVTSYATRIAEVKDPSKSYDEEMPVGNDSGFLWRLNSYWRFEAVDGGLLVRCEAISLSRDVPFGLGFIRGFLERFPKDSMRNTLEGTRAAVESRKVVSSGAN